MQAYSDPRRASDPHALPDGGTVYYVDRESWPRHAEGYRHAESGWYWGDDTREPVGPFATEAEALADAQREGE